jgi:hypothetical protein
VEFARQIEKDCLQVRLNEELVSEFVNFDEKRLASIITAHDETILKRFEELAGKWREMSKNDSHFHFYQDRAEETTALIASIRKERE